MGIEGSFLHSPRLHTAILRPLYSHLEKIQHLHREDDLADLRSAGLKTRKSRMQPSWKTPLNPVGGIFCVRTILLQSLAQTVLNLKPKKSTQIREKQTGRAMLLGAHVLRHIRLFAPW